LNILSKNNEFFLKLPEKSILTPHPKEFERLAGEVKNDFHRLELQKEFSQKYNVIVVYKGGYTTTTTPDGNFYFNSTGNPGLATGGTGDVLAGIIGSLLGQGYSPEDAALLGVFLHGLAGNKALKKKGVEAVIASDVIESIPDAYYKLTGFKNFVPPIAFN
jgi:ADP-dependent NAD(P)H-hydrate dehydratase / NAD(P)H-hydrate epimerase